jgi:hypothetical protein
MTLPNVRLPPRVSDECSPPEVVAVPALDLIPSTAVVFFNDMDDRTGFDREGELCGGGGTGVR